MNGINGLKLFLFEDKWGYRDNEGNVLVEPLWDYADNFHEGFAIVRNDKGFYGFLNSDGQMALECQYEEAMKFIDGVALVKTKDGNWEHINCKGEFLHNCPWIDVYPYSEGLAAVRKPINDNDRIRGITARYGFINEERELVVPCDYSQVSSFRNGYARVTNVYGDNCYVSKDGQEKNFIYKKINCSINDTGIEQDDTIVLPEEWANKWDLNNKDCLGGYHHLKYEEGLSVVVGNNGKFGYISSQGELIIPCKWKWASQFHDGLALVGTDDQKVGFINKKGEFIIAPRWNIRSLLINGFGVLVQIKYSEGLAPLKGKNNRWGFIDKKGKLQIPFKWMSARNFHEGFAAVKGFNGKYAFINYRGNLICKLKWDEVGDFHEGLASVYDENIGKFGFIDTSGNLVIPCKCQSVSYAKGSDFFHCVAYVKLYGQPILIDDGGNPIPFSDYSYDNYKESRELSTYDNYRGSYAQDEMGYSDDEIDTIFDGDPDAYWNID